MLIISLNTKYPWIFSDLSFFTLLLISFIINYCLFVLGLTQLSTTDVISRWSPLVAGVRVAILHSAATLLCHTAGTRNVTPDPTHYTDTAYLFVVCLCPTPIQTSQQTVNCYINTDVYICIYSYIHTCIHEYIHT